MVEKVVNITECPPNVECSIEKVLDVLEGKWSFLIIKNLFEGTRRFGELRKALHEVSPKTLTMRLRELEINGIIERKSYATIPPKVEYSLTEKGRSLDKVIKEMKLWGSIWT
ncbi:MAG: helix-turn-helix transcriptional regulator [Clostridiaceae bacterium]|nr:helix-turn-helix transcriptional regulator [Clostridiaceae bacterium]